MFQRRNFVRCLGIASELGYTLYVVLLFYRDLAPRVDQVSMDSPLSQQCRKTICAPFLPAQRDNFVTRTLIDDETSLTNSLRFSAETVG